MFQELVVTSVRKFNEVGHFCCCCPDYPHLSCHLLPSISTSFLYPPTNPYRIFCSFVGLDKLILGAAVYIPVSIFDCFQDKSLILVTCKKACVAVQYIGGNTCCGRSCRKGEITDLPCSFLEIQKKFVFVSFREFYWQHQTKQA